MEKQDCYFYHTMDLPGGETVEGDWDLRPVLKEYTGGVDFKRKRVIDIGTATGALSFYAEKMGAEAVTSFDQSPDHPLNLLPCWDQSLLDIDRMKNGYRYCHERLGSSAVPIYGDIYDLPFHPPAHGGVDIAILGSVLLHLENPFGALREACRVADTVVVTEVLRAGMYTSFRPLMTKGNDYLVWWYLPPDAISDMLVSLGFRATVPKSFMFTATSPKHGACKLFCVVGKRIR